MNKNVTPFSFARFFMMLITCDWIETSSAEIGSSAIISFGSVIKALAITILWRWPPENSCGYL